MKDLVDVLVVGAGPVGLALACGLARHGLRVRVIERMPEPATTSRAFALHARTLEILDDFGIVDRALEAGNRLGGVSAFAGRRRILHFRLDRLETRYPFVLILPQSETERILEGHLRALGASVERGAELASFEQDADGVTAEVRHADGLVETARAAWMVGCDGAHSTVRHGLGIPFEGDEYEEEFVLADVAIEGELVRDEANAYFHPRGVVAFFPRREVQARVVAQVPVAGNGLGELTLPEIQALVDERGPGGLRLCDPTWLSRFRIHHRRVRRYRDRRVLLAGDAAHIHSPVGGQGMNTGIQDAHNLAWKLASVIAGMASPGLLESYEIERAPVAKVVLQMTALMTDAVTTQSRFLQGLRNRVMPLAGGLPPLQRRIAARVAELDIGYRKSPIVAESWRLGLVPWRRGPAAGDRAPDGVLRDAESGDTRRIHELARGGRHTLLLFDGWLGAGGGARALESVAEAVDRALGDRVSIHTILSERSRRVGRRSPLWIDPGNRTHELYAASRPSLYLIRPDGHVGFRGRPPAAAPLLAYFEHLAMRPG